MKFELSFYKVTLFYYIESSLDFKSKGRKADSPENRSVFAVKEK